MFLVGLWAFPDVDTPPAFPVMPAPAPVVPALPPMRPNPFAQGEFFFLGELVRWAYDDRRLGLHDFFCVACFFEMNLGMGLSGGKNG